MNAFLVLLCTTGLVHAAPDAAPQPTDAPTAEASPEPTLEYEALLRPEYLAGQPITVPVRIWNSSTSTLTAPDLERRPWLVGFTFKVGDGELERRRTTPPETDPGQTIRLAPRSQRRTLLQLPLGHTLSPGEYDLQVQLSTTDPPQALATATVQVAQPRPVEADLLRGVSAARRSTDHTVWLHKAADGFDLYLTPVSGLSKGRTRWLAHIPDQVRPILTESSSAEGGTRHVAWQNGKRGIGWLAVEAPGVESIIQTFETPWPAIELIGQPATDGSGNLHVPIWIPAPKGKNGEIRILTVMDRGAVSYRRAAAFKRRPVSVVTTVDDAGSVQLLVATDEAVDLYSVRTSGDAHTGLPIPGRRVLRADEGTAVVDAQFGLLPSTGDSAGGLSVLTTTQANGQLRSQWSSLRGTPLHALAATPLPENGVLKDVLPGQTPKTVGYLFKTGERAAQYVETTRSLVFEESLHGDWGLIRGSDGVARLVRTAKETVFVSRSLNPTE